jgi:hypothetical protein
MYSGQEKGRMMIPSVAAPAMPQIVQGEAAIGPHHATTNLLEAGARGPLVSDIVQGSTAPR